MNEPETYRHLPTQVTAIRYTGKNLDAVRSFYPSHIQPDMLDEAIEIQSNHGPNRVEPGDWVVQTPYGDFYGCTNHFFERNYEPV